LQLFDIFSATHVVSNPLKKLAGQTVIYGLGTILPRFLNYFLTPILTRIFLPAEYGINSELYAYMSFVNIIFVYGMETTFFNFYSKLDNKAEVYNTAVMSLLCSSALFSVILLFFAPAIGEALSTPNATYPAVFITWCVLIVASDAVTSVPFARLRAEGKPLKFAILKIVNVLVNFSLTVFFVDVCKNAYERHDQNFYSVLYNPHIGIGYCFLSSLIANLVSLVLLSRSIFPAGAKLNTVLLKQMLTYTWPLIILGLAGMINETLDRLILKRLMADKAEAQIAQGIYGGCYKIAILMTIFIQAFRFSAEPFFFSKARDKDSKQLYAVVMKYFIIFCLLLLLGTLLNLHWIRYFIDENFWSGLRVVPVLLLANLCLGIVYNLSIWYKLSGRTRFGAMIAIFGAVITIVVNVIFIPRYSYMACAWATLAAYAGMMFLSYYLGQKFFPIKYNLRAIGTYAVITLLLYVLSLTYGGMQNVSLKLTLNNLLIVIFGWIVYKLEFQNLKKISDNADPAESN
jgi:O-antigen/teichoic acid export membrane protein